MVLAFVVASNSIPLEIIAVKDTDSVKVNDDLETAQQFYGGYDGDFGGEIIIYYILFLLLIEIQF